VTDTIVYWVIVGLLFGFICWLLLAPYPGHDPLVQFMHATVVR
jgi:hypothetical protein